MMVSRWAAHGGSLTSELISKDSTEETANDRCIQGRKELRNKQTMPHMLYYFPGNDGQTRFDWRLRPHPRCHVLRHLIRPEWYLTKDLTNFLRLTLICFLYIVYGSCASVVMNKCWLGCLYTLNSIVMQTQRILNKLYKYSRLHLWLQLMLIILIIDSFISSFFSVFQNMVRIQNRK